MSRRAIGGKVQRERRRFPAEWGAQTGVSSWGSTWSLIL